MAVFEKNSSAKPAVDPEAKVMFTKHAWTPPWLKVMAVGVTVPPGLALTRKSPAALTTAPATATWLA